MFKKKEKEVISFDVNKQPGTESESASSVSATNAGDKPEKKKGKKKRKKIGVIIGVMIVIVVAVAIAGSKGSDVAMPVSVAEVLKGDITQTVDASGSVESEETKVYFSDVSAPVRGLDLVVGQQVKAGDVLLSYDTTGMENTLKQTELEAQITKTGADVSITGIQVSEQKATEAAANYEEAVKYVQHYTDCVNRANAQLYEASVLADKQTGLLSDIEEISKKLESKPNSDALKEKLSKKQEELKKVEKELKQYNVKELQNTLEICSADLSEYKMQKEQYEAQKEADPTAGLQKKQQALIKESADFTNELAKEALAKAQKGVIAEFDGIITSLGVVDGQTAVEGGELFTIKNIDKVKVTLSISKYDIEKIKIGQKATVTINGNVYDGEVSAISRMASINATGGTVVETDIHIKNPDDAIVLGVEGKVKIETAQETGVLLIPSSCINYASEGVFCYTVEDGKVKKVTIETGVADDEFTQILSGLQEGDQVIKDITTEIEENQLVTVLDEPVADDEITEGK